MELEKIQNFEAKFHLARMRSAHQCRVDAFMAGAEQDLPASPQTPDPATRVLRARLMFEEVMETINALGVEISVTPLGTGLAFPINPNCRVPNVTLEPSGKPDLTEIVDGCLDVAVVTTGTLSACGVADMLPQQEVDENNLLKFAEGHSIDEGGKLIKPPNHPKPDLQYLITAQRP